MRKRIFTPKEREIILGFLSDKIPAKDPAVRQIVFRVRHFTDLPEDVTLYARLREAITT